VTGNGYVTARNYGWGQRYRIIDTMTTNVQRVTHEPLAKLLGRIATTNALPFTDYANYTV